MSDDLQAPSDPKPEQCSSCRFWDQFSKRQKADGTGYCRRYPPRDTVGFIDMPDYQWCGEYQKAPPKLEALIRKLEAQGEVEP